MLESQSAHARVVHGFSVEAPHRNHVWSYDFVEAPTYDGRKLQLMTLIDEFTRECLAIRVARRINRGGPTF